MFSKFTIFCTASCLVVSALSAAPAVIVTQETIPKRVRAENPDLAAARLRINEAVGRMKQAGRLDNPQLETSFQHTRDFREGAIELGISQKFPVTDRLKREKSISVTELKAAELEVRQVEQKLVADANRSLIEVLAIRQRKVLLNRQSALTQELAESIRVAAEKGEGSLLEASQARMEAMQTETEARQLDAKEAAALAELKPLLGIHRDEGLVVSGSLASPQLPGSGANPSRRADFQLSKVEADIARQTIGLEKSKRREDFEGSAFVSGERGEDAPSGYENEAVVGVRLKIPLPFWNKNEGNIEAAEATHQRKQLETRALAESIRHEAGGARAEMAEWTKLIREIDATLLPMANQQVTDTETAWHNGQAEFQSVLKSRAQRLQLEVNRLDALRDFHLARARHQAALGNY